MKKRKIFRKKLSNLRLIRISDRTSVEMAKIHENHENHFLFLRYYFSKLTVKSNLHNALNSTQSNMTCIHLIYTFVSNSFQIRMPKTVPPL